MHGSVGAGTTGLSLNAPSGAGCFLTTPEPSPSPSATSLNAPSGTGYFLTRRRCMAAGGASKVLMHLLVLGAF